ncbi:MAG TPA: alanine racemase [Anaerolineales bacterium]|nr:alanine racemase [Anaerolineales bacterium]HNA53319.1 alanine racemase [Anaerolineales bacterium]HNC87859.1 alanine racemase [Anaerolineales bacterium]HND90794.1 alanine racemase [Anaerolineales bacterium]HNH03390.1 alanine racemase [Anaerolineales bacterium]
MRPTFLEVNLTQLKQNLENIRAKVAPAKVLVVLKANAYGHGVDGVAPFIAPFADYIGVAIAEEGIHLRKMGIATPILVMGGTLPQQLPDFFEYDLTLAASSLDLLTAAEQLAASTRKRLKIHLKVDTGMERIGVREYEADSLIELALSCSHLDLEGIFTHFANSEVMSLQKNMTPLSLQLERFEEILALFEKRGAPQPRIRHTANSGAILLHPESYYDMVRPGVLFYGVYPGRDVEKTIEVRPALTWRSKVVYSKITQPGRGVSYGSLWQAEAESRVVTVPCGYADGYFRRMTNQARVNINGRLYPQVGRICMDQFMVNAGEDVVKVGDEVILLGGGITAEDLADWTGTNEYEVMTNISARVPRVFTRAVQ